MSNIRQLALTLILVSGTAFAVAGYMDSQSGKLRAEAEPGALILELQPMRAMARPLCASSTPAKARFKACPPAGSQKDSSTPSPMATVHTGSGRTSSSTSAGIVRPISAILVFEDSPAPIPASAAKPKAF
ncbi:MAG: hypothetical protein ACI8TQ_001321 [Planctomycetota bacterium]|jgi:hypothetical protein